MHTKEVPLTLPKKVSVVTLGCSKNTYDSEILVGQLTANNLLYTTDVAKADTVIVNTCGFIDAAKEESINTIIELAKRKQKGKLDTLIVAGCLSERYGDELEKEIPEVDHFFGTEAFSQIIKSISPDLKHVLLGERSLSTPKHFAYLKISEGCDNPCSFCAIPLMRGGHRSRSMEDIIREAEMLVAQGVKELIVIGQDTTYYGLDLYKKRMLAQLLEALSDVKGVQWIRLMYAYPAKFPHDILPVINSRANICKYIDMPMQHISTNVLKSMRRGITRRTLEELMNTIKKEVPGISLRTTFIVGYPAETEADFEELCDFVSQGYLDRMGVFTYSQEDDTYADILGDPIPQEVKEERKEILMKIQEKISRERNINRIGTEMNVLIDEVINGEYQGRTEFDAPEVDNEVYIRSKTPLQVGEFIKVTIEDAAEHDLFATYDA